MAFAGVAVARVAFAGHSTDTSSWMATNAKQAKPRPRERRPQTSRLPNLLRFDRSVWLPGLMIVALTLLAYFPVLSAGFIWDDPDYVVNNHTLRTLSGVWEIWTHPPSLPQWYPMVHTTFWVEYQLWQLWAPGYHVVNVLLHAGGAILLWRLARFLQVPGALLAGLVFALHPVHVESVAWITERKNVLSGLFYLASLLVYLRGALPRDEKEPIGAFLKTGSYWISLGLFLLALWSKTVTSTLPAALLVILWWKRGTLPWRDAIRLIPFFLLGIALGLFTAYTEFHRVGARADIVPELDINLLQRVLVAGRVIAFYAWSLVWPVNLMFIYPRWEVDPSAWWQWWFPIGVIAVLGTLALSCRWLGRGPLAAVLLFCGTLFPALGFINVYPMRFSWVADHFQYHASIYLIILLAALVHLALARAARSPQPLYALLLLPLGVLTCLNCFKYEDALTLWSVTSRQNLGSWMVWTNLGNALAALGRHDEAIPHHEQALRLAPHLHDTHWNVGVGHMRRGDLPAAEAEFQTALQINPHFAPAYDSLAQIYHFRRNDPTTAEKYYLKALEIAPQWFDVNFRYGVLLKDTGRPDQALIHLRRAVAAKPADPDARDTLGTVAASLQRFDEAAANYRELVRLQPRSAVAHNKLAWALLLDNRRPEAIEHFRRALALDPSLEHARRGLQIARGQ